jgi:hypothetical protein
LSSAIPQKIAQYTTFLKIDCTQSYFLEKEKALDKKISERVYFQKAERFFFLCPREQTKTVSVGERLTAVLDEPLNGNSAYRRGVYVDGCYYMLGENDFKVFELNLEG